MNPIFCSSNDWDSSDEDNSSNASSTERYKPAPRRAPGRRGRGPGRPPARTATRSGVRTKKAQYSDTDMSDSDDDDDVRRNSNRRASQKVRYGEWC